MKVLTEESLRFYAMTDAVDGSRGFRDEVKSMARELIALRANVGATQARCTELLTEVRALRRRSDPAYVGPDEDPRCAEVRASIAKSIARLEYDALRVVDMNAARLVVGRAQYGDLVLATDPRNMLREALMEMLDGSSYFAARLIKMLDEEKGVGGSK